MALLALGGIAISVLAYADSKAVRWSDLKKQEKEDFILKYLEYARKADMSAIFDSLGGIDDNVFTILGKLDSEIIPLLETIEKHQAAPKLVTEEFERDLSDGALTQAMWNAHRRLRIGFADMMVPALESDRVKTHAFGQSGFLKHLRDNQVSRYRFEFFCSNSDRRIKVEKSERTKFIVTLEQAGIDRFREFLSDAEEAFPV